MSIFKKIVSEQTELNQADLDSLRALQKAEVQMNHFKAELSDTNSIIHQLKSQLNIATSRMSEAEIASEQF